MKLYRILTEDKNRQDIEKLVGIVFDGFPIYSVTRYWKGQRKASLVIEIYAPDLDAELVRFTAEAIKLANGQESVLMLELEARGGLV